MESVIFPKMWSGYIGQISPGNHTCQIAMKYLFAKISLSHRVRLLARRICWEARVNRRCSSLCGRFNDSTHLSQLFSAEFVFKRGMWLMEKLTASEPRAKLPPAESSVWKRSKHYRDVRELLLLHKRYEVDAMRALKRSKTSIDQDKEKRRQRIARTASAGGNAGVSLEPRKDKKKNSVCGMDSGYLSQIMSGIGSDRGLKLVTTPPRPKALRLPKLDCIPQGSKAIFYTNLPCMPALPSVKEPKSSPRSAKRINRTDHKSGVRQYALPEGCLKVRQLPSDHAMLRDGGSVTASGNNDCSKSALQIANRSDDISGERSHTAVGEGLYWLVPVLDESSFRLNRKSGEKPTNKYNNDRAKKQGTSQETATPKYKRSVHFSEFLHEVHLYTPVSTKHESLAWQRDGGHAWRCGVTVERHAVRTRRYKENWGSVSVKCWIIGGSVIVLLFHGSSLVRFYCVLESGYPLLWGWGSVEVLQPVLHQPPVGLVLHRGGGWGQVGIPPATLWLQFKSPHAWLVPGQRVWARMTRQQPFLIGPHAPAVPTRHWDRDTPQGLVTSPREVPFGEGLRSGCNQQLICFRLWVLSFRWPSVITNEHAWLGAASTALFHSVERGRRFRQSLAAQ